MYKIPGRKLTAQRTIKRKSDLIFIKTVVIYKVILYSKDVRTAASGVLSLFLLIFWSYCVQSLITVCNSSSEKSAVGVTVLQSSISVTFRLYYAKCTNCGI